jgi:Lon protease-like protein
MKIPLFPLQTILYPDGPLSLRIFERRYLDMVKVCLSSEKMFGIVLSNQAFDSDKKGFCDLGTMARIVDWNKGSDGILGLTVIGENKFIIKEIFIDDDGLNIGNIEMVEKEEKFTVPEKYESLVTLLKSLINEFGDTYKNVRKDYQDATWVGNRLAEILPIEVKQKQTFLEISDPIDRLELINTYLTMTQAMHKDKNNLMLQ